MEEKTYIAIDLKSFFASVECVERGLDPLSTNLVVADGQRTEKTICLAVTPSLKKYGIGGRARLFEVVQKIKEVNIERKLMTSNGCFKGKTYDDNILSKSKDMEVSYIVASPRMACYMEYSTKIFDIYLKYISKEDMHVYSIDEVFMDVTSYLKTYKMTAHKLAITIIRDVLKQTGITATAGIGTNMYLCKVAMDIVAKKMPADKDGVRIAELDEIKYRKLLWEHTPITDFWRVGKGYAKKLQEFGMYTMGDVARCSLGKEGDFYNQKLLYKLFGINAELLIDHAWGYEPVTIKSIKDCRPQRKSLSTGQVLQCPYNVEKTRLIVKEMTDLLVLDLVEKKLVTEQIVLTVGYDIENMLNPEIKKIYKGELSTDAYGRVIPKNAHGTINLDMPTSSTKKIMEAVLKLYDSIINKDLLTRRIYVVATKLQDEEKVETKGYEQLDLFTDYGKRDEELEKEKKMQKAIIDIQKKFGKNAVLKGMNLEEGATTKERNSQIGGHKA